MVLRFWRYPRILYTLRNFGDEILLRRIGCEDRGFLIMIKMLIKCFAMMVGVKTSGDQFFVKELCVFGAFSSRFALLRIFTVEF